MATSDLISKLLPCFVAALAVQRAMELTDLGIRYVKPSDDWPTKKSIYLIVTVIITAIVAAMNDRFRILAAVSVIVPPWIDVMVSALVISGGTETMNEIFKFLGYKKDETKLQAKDQALQQNAVTSVPVHLLRS